MTSTSTYPVGAIARYDRPMDRAQEALDALPKPAARLLETAREAGWGWVVGWGEDTGGSAFVTVHVQAGVPESRGPRAVEATWHTRGTGTPRLFGLLVRNRSFRWQDMSLRAAMATITAEEAAA